MKLSVNAPLPLVGINSWSDTEIPAPLWQARYILLEASEPIWPFCVPFCPIAIKLPVSDDLFTLIPASPSPLTFIVPVWL